MKSFSQVASELGINTEISKLAFDSYFKQEDIPKPLGRNVLIQILPRENKIGELFITTLNDDDIEFGLALSKGEDVNCLEAGDKVGVSKKGGEMIRINVGGTMTEYKVISYWDIKFKF